MLKAWLVLLPLCLAAGAEAPLLANGSFETDANGDGWPDGWARPEVGASWETEAGNRFLRLISPEPGKMILLYHQLLLRDGVEAVTLRWRQRVSNLRRGKESWFDARIMIEFRDRDEKKVAGAPGAPAVGRDTDGWQDKSLSFLVPEGARWLVLMPCLFQVQSGTFDLDDLTVVPTDPAPLRAAAEERARATREKQTRDAAARREKAAAVLAERGTLISNGDFEADRNNDQWPDDWGRLAEATWETEAGNRFLRLTAREPDQLVLVYRLLDLPAVGALELTWRQRVTGLKTGAEPWYDARIMLEFKDEAGAKMATKPSPPYTQRDTPGWVEKRTAFLVPEGAVALEFMPCLFNVRAGTFDLDDFILRPTDPEPLLAARAKAEADRAFANVPPEPPAPEKWPPALRVRGNQLLDDDGRPVWLQGVNVVSLEFLVTGDHVLRSILVATDEWRANAIRLPVKEDYWFGATAGQKDGGRAYRELVDAAITMAANHGAYTILDLHRYRAPQAIHAEFWRDAATRYKDHPAVIFDLFNEPHGTSWEVWRNGGFVADEKAPALPDGRRGFQAIGMQGLVDAVRGVGATNVLLCGGLDWAYDLTGIATGHALDERGGRGIIYASHIYPWKSDWAGKVLLIADRHPILLGECGADVKKMDFIPAEAQEDPHTWVPDLLGLIQRYHLHWTGFSFHPGATPVMITGWDYTPTEFWGAYAKRALAGEAFELKRLR